MPGNGFVHLHVHSHYSLLDGACSVDGLLDATQAAQMKSVAITDHGNLFGALEFYRAARERGVKPIIGIEAYLAPKSRFDKTRSERQEVYYHMLLLARDATGYRNLVKLASAAYKEGFYYRPRVDKELLRRHGEGLIATSGCLQGEVNQLLLAGDEDGARTALREYREIFGAENYYLEVQDHGIADQRRLNPMVRALGKETRTPLVATNDLHYLARDGAHAHDALLCISTGKLMSDPDRWRFDGSEFWFKGEADMRAAMPDYHDAIDRTVEIADRCNVEIPLGKARFPEYRHTHGIPNLQLLRKLCAEGLARRYGAKPAKEARDRLEHELGVIERLGFVNYFLVVWDLIHHAREDGIPVGPGRGSSAGSLVAYCLEITNVDPLRFDLLFDRFLNADRHEPPDIDIDICQAGRGRVIEYVRQRYGEANVAQIITFGTLAARRVVRDVGRVLDIPLAEVDAIAKLIPAGPGVTLEKALAETPELVERVQADARARELIEISRKLEGLARNAGTHAAGVVISDRPLEEEVPVYLANDEVSTQYQMNDVGALGLLKMDLLGLETLTALEEVRRLVAETRGEAPVLPMNELDDPAVYALLQRGDATGVFQLESEGMRSLLLRLKPDRFEDLIAVLALYRPGPLGSGMVDSYVRRKHGEEPLAYLHKTLEPLLAETNGVILYQEQVMRIANRLGGFTLSQADTLRKAMGKKKPDVMAKFKAQFIEGAGKNKIPADIADQIWAQMEFFSGYGFNKCVVGETRVADARTGEVTSVLELFRRRRPFTVHALGDDWKLRPRRVTDVVWNGRRRVFALRTAQGRELVATGNHPVRTLEGWTHVSALRPGDSVAAADGSSSGPLSCVAPDLSRVARDGADAEAVAAAVAEASRDAVSIAWDTVIEILPRGVADTFDLTVEVDHNFVADGLVVHNSHSTAYALISYQTAWCKVKFPAEFMAAMLTIKSDDLDKIADFANDCRHAGLEILPPDINRSDARFRVEGTKIRYGLAAVKGVGERAVEAIVAARKARGTFGSLYDIPESVDSGLVNRQVLDALVKCGACDALGPRAALAAALDDALAVGAAAADARRRGQADLFGGGATPPPPPLPAVAEWPEAQRLADEKALTGLYHSSHPLARHAAVFDRFMTARAATLAEKEQGAEVVAGGMVRALRKTVTKTGKTPGQRMALFEIEDLTGKMKAVIFPRDYERAQLFLVPDKIVVVRARVDKSRDEPGLKVSEVIPIERARERLCTRVIVRIAETDATDEHLRALGGIIRDAGGEVPVFIRFTTADGAESVVRAGHAYTVSPSEKFDAACRQLLGEGHVEYL